MPEGDLDRVEQTEIAGEIGALKQRIAEGQTSVTMEELAVLDSNLEDATPLVPIIIKMIENRKKLDRNMLCEEILAGHDTQDPVVRAKNINNVKQTIHNLIYVGVLGENEEKNKAVELMVEIKE